MASPSQIHLTPEDTGLVKFKPQTQSTADITSALLQENHEKHHIFSSEEGFHNHIAHHLLTLYGLGASADQIEKHYRRNASYQRPPMPAEGAQVEDLSDPETFKTILGKGRGDQYHNFLLFFQKEMENKGQENVLQEYVFSGTELADKLLGLLFAGFLHPIIHLGLGLEFNQPAIVCEALAQAAVHTDWANSYFINAEIAAKTQTTSRTLPELLNEIRNDRKLSTAAEWTDPNKVRDGILKRAPEEAVKYTSQWSVNVEDLEEKTAEMINNVIYFTAGAQHPPQEVRFDFYFMHCLNSSIFWSTFNSLPWLSNRSKARLLEWKGRFDLVMYASRRSPAILLDEITQYTPKDKDVDGGHWDTIFQRLFKYSDDGHAVKLGRAVAHGENVSANLQARPWCNIKGYMFEKIGNMVVDSIESDGVAWVRSAGFEEAWKDYRERPRDAEGRK